MSLEPATTFRVGYVDTSLGQVHYRECGTGRPLLLLHQPPRSSLVYRTLMAALQEQGGIRSIALDLPGFGQSCDLPPGTTIPEVASVVAQAVQALEDGPVNVFGLHTGNKIGAALAAGHPRLVDRLVLAGMTHSIILEAARRNQAMQDYVRNKVPTDPMRHPQAWRDEQLDRMHARGVDTLYAANYSFDLAAALPRIEAATLVLEIAVPQEEVYGRQAAAWCTLLRQGQALQLAGDDRELLNAGARPLAAAIASFIRTGQAIPT